LRIFSTTGVKVSTRDLKDSTKKFLF